MTRSRDSWWRAVRWIGLGLGLGLLAAPLGSWPGACAASKPAPPPPVKLPAAPDLEAAEELRRIMEQDDAAQDEVLQWIEADTAARQRGDGADPALRMRIEQRLAPVRKAYDDFLVRHPRHAPARLAYGSFLNDIGQPEAAANQWEKARKLDPANPAAWNNLANHYGHHGPVKKAFQYYGKAIELNPTEPVYCQNLATTVFLFRPDAMEYYGMTEDQVFQRSLELYRKAMELDPTNFVLATDFAQSFYIIKPPASLTAEDRDKAKKKLEAEALAAWEHALKLAHNDFQREGVRIHLARLQINALQLDQARQHLDAITNTAYANLKQRLLRNLESKATENRSATAVP